VVDQFQVDERATLLQGFEPEDIAARANYLTLREAQRQKQQGQAQQQARPSDQTCA
jgi:hypothetical protein